MCWRTSLIWDTSTLPITFFSHKSAPPVPPPPPKRCTSNPTTTSSSSSPPSSPQQQQGRFTNGIHHKGVKGVCTVTTCPSKCNRVTKGDHCRNHGKKDCAYNRNSIVNYLTLEIMRWRSEELIIPGYLACNSDPAWQLEKNSDRQTCQQGKDRPRCGWWGEGLSQFSDVSLPLRGSPTINE